MSDRCPECRGTGWHKMDCSRRASRIQTIDEMLGIDRSDPVQRLACDLVEGDLRFLDELVAVRREQFTQIEIAERMGVSQATVSQFEAGRDPRLSTIRRYALALGVRIEHTVSPAEDV